MAGSPRGSHSATVAERAQRSQDAGRVASAAAARLLTATYYVTAFESHAKLLPTFRKHRKAWDRWGDLVDLNIERISIPYEATILLGYMLKPAAPGGSRATLIAVNGSDGPQPSPFGSGRTLTHRSSDIHAGVATRGS